MALQVLLVLSAISLACGQLGMLEGPVREYVPISGAQLRTLELEQNPELLALAAASNERIFIEITSQESASVVREGTNVNMDCLPWLSLFPGGSIRWLMLQRDENGIALEPEPQPVDPTPEDELLTSATVVGGPFDRWYNITSAIIVAGAEDPSFGDYICSVCIARGTPFEECHNATMQLHILGAPPRLVRSNEPEEGPGGGLVYDIGSNFCLNPPPMQESIFLQCLILEGGDIPQVVPQANRTWVKDGIIIYSGVGNEPFNEEFLMSGNNSVFMVGVINPPPLNIMQLSATGGIVFNTEFFNVSMSAMLPEGVTEANFQEATFQAILGDYTCSVDNVYGGDSAMTTIRVCGDDPIVPSCQVETLFPDNGETVPAGCNVCIEFDDTIFLSCLATNGTPPFTYMWTGPGGFTASESAIRVSREGVYNCTVTNLDDPVGVMLSSDVFETPPSRLMTTVRDRARRMVSGTGCDRLLSEINPEPDLCLLVGEEFDATCGNNDVLLEDGTVFVGSVDVTADLDGVTLRCNIVTNTPCDAAANNITLRVFDPARVNRSAELLLGEIGAGQTTTTQLVAEVGSVTLVCPTMGIDDPTTTWFRIITSSEVNVTNDGRQMQVPVDENDPRITISMRDDFTSVLTIIAYSGQQDDGVYVCATENIAGRDSALVVLSSTLDDGEWIAGSFGRCNVECNDGVRVRSVTCRSMRDGRLLANSRCLVPRPATVGSCAVLFPEDCFLTPIFVSGEFGPCSQGCQGGFRERSVVCTVPMTGEVLRDSRCFPLRKPSVFEPCPNTCCIEDTYGATCRRIGTTMCNLNLYQQMCCWTCLLRVKPY